MTSVHQSQNQWLCLIILHTSYKTTKLFGSILMKINLSVSMCIFGMILYFNLSFCLTQRLSILKREDLQEQRYTQMFGLDDASTCLGKSKEIGGLDMHHSCRLPQAKSWHPLSVAKIISASWSVAFGTTSKMLSVAVFFLMRQ